MTRQLRRIPKKGWAGGVCAGLAYWLGTSKWVVRWVFMLLFSVFDFGATLYLLLWLWIPKLEEIPEDYEKITGGS